MLRRNSPALLLAIGFALAGCDAGRKTAETVPEVTTYEARGVLREVLADGRRAVIAHEAIPGYMAAMTMEFTAAEAQELAGLVPGDALAFRLSVTETESWIDEVRKTGHVELPSQKKEEPLPAPGETVPNVTLVDQSGRTMRLGEFQGRALAVTFIYTRCPLPDYCPLLSTRFAEVQRALASAGRTDGWHLLSITIDPEHDTPERLGEYARRHAADPGHWTFATGEPAEIARLSGFFGLAVFRAGAEWNHNLRTAVIGPDGSVRKVFTGNRWTAEELAAELRGALPASR